VIGWIGLQAIVNMGAVTGLLPITGVPLPLVSFGGTALVVTLVGVGMLASVARDAAAPPKAQRGSSPGR
jgi:cell division protein FtsW